MIQILDFWAEWCKGCVTMLPLFKELEKEYLNLEFISVDCDTDDGAEMVDEFKIRNLPTIIVLKDGIEVERVNGTKSKQQLKELVERWS